MSTLLHVPPRPTTSRHDHNTLRTLSERIKVDVKEMLLTPCEGKGCTGTTLAKRVCAKCKGPVYCSTECQRASWPTHRMSRKLRSICHKRFISTLSHNRILMCLLEALFIVHFNLAERKPGPSSGPLLLSASIDMPPYGWLGKDVYHRTPLRPPPVFAHPSGIDVSGRRRNAGVEAFLQITQFAYVPDFLAQEPEQRHIHTIVWEMEAAQESDSPPESQVQFIGILLLNDGARNNYPSCPIPIRRKAIDAFRDGTFFHHIESALGERVPRPLAVKTLIQYFNRHIEADVENYCGLRTRLRPNKKTLIPWARDVLRTLSQKQNLSSGETIRCLRVYNPDGTKMELN